MFNIFRKPQPKFPSTLEFYTYNNWKFIKRVPVQASGKTFFLETMPNKEHPNSITIITDKHYNPIGTHDYQMQNIPNILDGNEMAVVEKKQGLGLGEILRLASIVEMKENGIDKIIMESVPSAMPFHIKYKLTPSICIKNDLINVLKKIASSEYSVGTFPEEAAKILSDMLKNNFGNCNYYGEVNSLVAKYIRGNAGRWNVTKLDMQMPMSLTRSDVKKYASFYNKLFKKHGIDYKI